MARPRISISTDQLKHDAEVRRREACEVVEHTSSLPLAMFGTCDPMVEAKLVDDVVWQLLRHMNLDSGCLPRDAAPDPIEENAITAQDIRALIEDLGHADTDAAPSLLEHLPQERLWILLDLVREGSGLARQRATVELREAMHHLAAWEGVNEHVLRELVHLLEEASQGGDKPVLFHALRIAAQRALQTQCAG